MILFFESNTKNIIAVDTREKLPETDKDKLIWLFNNASLIAETKLQGIFVGPRKEMITPWSTNAVEITQNMGITGINRIEEYWPSAHDNPDHDPMLQSVSKGLDQDLFTINHKPEPVIYIDNIKLY